MGLCPLLGEGSVSPSNTKSPGSRRSSIPSDILIHAAIWPQQMWPKNWGFALWGGVIGSPSKTMWPGPRPTCTPSFILIRPTVWPQCTNVTDRQDRQDRQRSDSIGRTVLQTVDQKTFKHTHTQTDWNMLKWTYIRPRPIIRRLLGQTSYPTILH